MSKKKLGVVHYLNQFFGQIGGEDKADVAFSVREGPVGPGVLLQKLLGEDGTIMATIICGDNYFAGNLDRASEEALKLVEPFKPDILFAGPAFAAGRYGLNCGEFCKKVGGKLRIPAITGMDQENPGVEIYRRDCYIAQTGNSAAKMPEAVGRMVSIARKVISTETHSKVLAGDQIGKPSEDDYFARGVLRNEHTEKTAACRGLDMLLAKIKGQPFVSEVVMARYDSIPPPPPVKDLASCEVALVSDCGLCPKGNPHGLSGRGNKVWCTYETKSLFPEKGPLPEYEVAHTGYYPKEVLENPYRILPVDILRDLEKEGIIAKFHPTYFCTSGKVTPNLVCHDMGEGIAAEIKKREIGAVILTST
jgi:glycine reductase